MLSLVNIRTFALDEIRMFGNSGQNLLRNLLIAFFVQIHWFSQSKLEWLFVRSPHIIVDLSRIVLLQRRVLGFGQSGGDHAHVEWAANGLHQVVLRTGAVIKLLDVVSFHDSFQTWSRQNLVTARAFGMDNLQATLYHLSQLVREIARQWLIQSFCDFGGQSSHVCGSERWE